MTAAAMASTTTADTTTATTFTTTADAIAINVTTANTATAATTATGATTAAAAATTAACPGTMLGGGAAPLVAPLGNESSDGGAFMRDRGWTSTYPKCGGCTSGVGRHRADCSKSMESTAAYTRAQLAGNLAGAAGLAGFSYGIGGSMTRLHGVGMGGDDYGDDDGEGGAGGRDDGMLLGLPGGREEEKRQRRLAINRRAAHNSRTRKKQLVESLKTTVADVLKQNESLRGSNQALQAMIYTHQMEKQSQYVCVFRMHVRCVFLCLR